MTKNDLKFLILILLIIYSIFYIYDEVSLGGATFGLHMFFNIPLGLLQLLFAKYLLKNSQNKLQKFICILGIIIAILVLIPAEVFYLISPNY